MDFTGLSLLLFSLTELFCLCCKSCANLFVRFFLSVDCTNFHYFTESNNNKLFIYSFIRSIAGDSGIYHRGSAALCLPLVAG